MSDYAVSGYMLNCGDYSITVNTMVSGSTQIAWIVDYSTNVYGEVVGLSGER